jgi:hypothetical protein
MMTTMTMKALARVTRQPKMADTPETSRPNDTRAGFFLSLNSVVSSQGPTIQGFETNCDHDFFCSMTTNSMSADGNPLNPKTQASLEGYAQRTLISQASMQAEAAEMILPVVTIDDDGDADDSEAQDISQHHRITGGACAYYVC